MIEWEDDCRAKWCLIEDPKGSYELHDGLYRPIHRRGASLKKIGDEEKSAFRVRTAGPEDELFMVDEDS